ncbi:MOSC domain-containing protein [Pseudooceanicola sp. CBS1P-1]|uniref:MOSC domain-containing protein n=1 Tax=Pseudooceanicola albus TaxID=2692189 RepID=A0A6L7G2G3_9RHOB|nr:MULTISPECIES: MOSC domain-containing protein [Pseudooceanicola]MBT9384896.1 MOSC domain-containing protein [Pseudooceanicola endophyticus]MXN18109.1 MOSC domain-containing protein [Pseudooceanicola albus]
MARVAQIWRHPIKGIGAEPLDSVTLTAGRPLPGDRAWAMTTGDTVDTGTWQSCKNFARGCFGPQLMAITARSAAGIVHLDHPTAGAIRIDPARDGAALRDWLAPLWPEARPALGSLIPAPEDTGLSDANYACLSVLGTASLAALSEACGRPLDPRRFRGNLWLSGLAPFEELDWTGRRMQIGATVLEVVERIDRCRATQVNPETGEEDTPTLATLRKTWGHIDFGVKARVIAGGDIATGQEITLL